MKTKFLIWLQEKLLLRAKTPWACFETSGMDADGRIGWSMRWNPAFIKHLHTKGFQGINDEETVQMFFMMSQMIPEELANQPDTINPAATPNLTNEANTLYR